jgi:hypothetical protein
MFENTACKETFVGMEKHVTDSRYRNQLPLLTCKR